MEQPIFNLMTSQTSDGLDHVRSQTTTVFGTPAYQALSHFKNQGHISQVVSLFTTSSHENSPSREAIDETRRLAKQMELRDSVTLVFAPQTQFETLLPANASEALVSFDCETGEIKREYAAKSTNPPILSTIMSITASLGLFIFVSMVNVYYVE